ncbi:MAG: glycosyltransferase family 2 protein [Polyangiaceae bacterium]
MTSPSTQTTLNASTAGEAAGPATKTPDQALGWFVGTLAIGLAVSVAWRPAWGGPGWQTVASELTGALAAALLVWRLRLAIRYHETPSTDDASLPFITVVVPAYNEGAQVARTLDSVVASAYPLHKLRVIAVNDGSADDTWLHIRAAMNRHAGRIEGVNCAENRGKRHALYEGILRARGQVLVTIDSDSEIEVDTLRNLVTPFVRDTRVGAVAGNVRVLARQTGALPRMLDVSFTYGFDFLRASQSEVGCVLCTPGALSAYRMDLLERALPVWMDQRFLGRRANIGEDRAMTNLILKDGWRVVFQRNARVHTEVPSTFNALSRMLLRWARSNVRETILMTRFVVRRGIHRGPDGLTLNYLQQLSRLLLTLVFTGPALWLLFTSPQLMLPLSVLGALLSAVLPALVYACMRRDPRRALWAFGYAFYSLLGLGWIQLYALVTPHHSAWLTRRLPQRARALSEGLSGPQPAE